MATLRYLFGPSRQLLFSSAIGILLLSVVTSSLEFVPNIESQQNSCSLSLLIPFRDTRLHLDGNNNEYSESIITDSDNIMAGISLLSAAILAINDFNNKQSALVPALQQQQESLATRCTKQFTQVQLFDTLRDATYVLAKHKKWSKNACAIVGVPDNNVANAVARYVATNNKNGGNTMNISVISHGAWLNYDNDDASSSNSNNLILGTANWKARMGALVSYLEATGAKKVALVYSPTNETKTYFRDLQQAADKCPSIQVYDAPSRRNKNHIASTLQYLQDNCIDTVIVAWMRDDHIGVLAQVANSLHMVLNQYTWIFMDSYLSPQYLDREGVPRTAVHEKLLSRTKIFQVRDPLVPVPVVRFDDSKAEKKRSLFLKSLQNNQENLVDKINAILHEKTGTNELCIGKNFFDDDRLPAYGAGFLYDSIIATGMAACQQEEEGLKLTADSFENVIEFEGVTGHFQIQNGVRNYKQLEYSVYILRKHFGRFMHVPVLSDRMVNGKWILEEPFDDQSLEEYAYSLGFALAGIAVLFCLAWAIFIYRNQDHPVVCMGQPIFLYTVCFGSSFFSLSIIFMSFDDSSIEDMELLDSFCMTQVWMSYCGQIIIYMALFSKLWRVKKVGRMRRQQHILPRHVIWPFLLFLFISLTILIVWTIIDPANFVRVELDLDDDFIEPISVPLCSYEEIFHTSSQIPIFFSMIVVLWMAYKTRNLPEDLTDSRKIAKVLLSHFLIVFIGLHFIVISIAFASFNMAYLIRVLINFFYATCTVGILIIPKYLELQKQKLNGDGAHRGTVRVSGLVEYVHY